MVSTTIISNPEDKKRLKQAIVEATHVLQQLDDNKEALKDLLKLTSEKFGLPTKTLRKLATIMYKQNYNDVQAEFEHFEILYETLFPNRDQEAA